jgi:hypothetical protein
VKPLATVIAAFSAASVASCNSTPATYPGKCGERLKGWLEPENGIGELSIWNVVRLDRSGALSWNRKSVKDQTLRTYLDEVSGMNPRPQMILTIDSGAACSRAQQVRTLMNATPICASGGCGEGTGWKDPGTGRLIS